MAGCTGNGGSKHVPQASDTLYTEKAAMDVYAKEPERALDIIDSALIVGNVKDDKASFLRAKVYSCAYEATRQDTAIVIGERLLNGKTAQDDVTFRQSVLEVLVIRHVSWRITNYNSHIVLSWRMLTGSRAIRWRPCVPRLRSVRCLSVWGRPMRDWQSWIVSSTD